MKGEMPSEYFLTLESDIRNHINKQIPQLVRNDGTTKYDQFEIKKMINQKQNVNMRIYTMKENSISIQMISSNS